MLILFENVLRALKDSKMVRTIRKMESNRIQIMCAKGHNCTSKKKIEMENGESKGKIFSFLLNIRRKKASHGRQFSCRTFEKRFGATTQPLCYIYKNSNFVDNVVDVTINIDTLFCTLNHRYSTMNSREIEHREWRTKKKHFIIMIFIIICILKCEKKFPT